MEAGRLPGAMTTAKSYSTLQAILLTVVTVRKPDSGHDYATGSISWIHVTVHSHALKDLAD